MRDIIYKKVGASDQPEAFNTDETKMESTPAVTSSGFFDTTVSALNNAAGWFRNHH